MVFCLRFAAVRTKEDTRGVRLRDEIPELLVDAQASNTRTGVGGLRPGFSEAISRVGASVHRKEASASRVTGAHGDAVGLGAFLLFSGEWCAKLSSSIAEQRRWSFGQRVADFSIPLVCRVSGGQPASLSFGCQIRRSVGSARIANAGWLDDSVRCTC